MYSLQLVAKIVCVGALGVLTACGFARVPHEGDAPSGSRSVTCDRSTGVADQVRVCPGDTLIGLSRQYNVTVLGIARENGLTDDRIQVGQILAMPNEFVHVVQPGDQALTLANRYGVPFSDLVAANGLRRPYVIVPEQRLAIPKGPVNTRIAEQPDRLPDSPGVTNEAPKGSVVIGSGAPPADTGRSQEPPQAFDEGGVRSAEDQPGVSGAPVPRNKPAEAVRTQSAKQVASAKPGAKPSGGGAKKKARPPAASFLLPVQGRIVSDFGPKSGGLHNDGINIAAPRGTPILATADGEVAYAGDGLPGFGNLILLRHADGWTSAYAHADSMAVARGDTVKRGGTIGTVGSTGSVTEPQLHFELRKHDRAVDPKPRLGP